MDDWEKFEHRADDNHRQSGDSEPVSAGNTEGNPENINSSSSTNFIIVDTAKEEEEQQQQTAYSAADSPFQDGASDTGNSSGSEGSYNVNDYFTEESQKKKKTPKFVTRKSLIIILIIAMVFSAGIGAGAYALAMSVFGGTTIDKSVSTTNYNLSTSTDSPLSVQEIVAKNENSVVAITTESVVTDTWLGQYVTSGAGSGVVITEDGYIVTNNHVIEDATTITVTFHDGTEVPATLVATDSQEDVAVIHVDMDNLIPVTFGDSSELTVGELAIAIGNPLGTLEGTATEGIISALEREITVDGKAMTLIQTSASINPGNSGGGLFDEYGNLIGIVVAKSSGSDVEGLGFAIPSNKVQEVAEDLMENGYVTGRPAAGITVLDLTSASLAMQYGVQYTGVYIYEVTGEKAKAAGLQAGDMIYYFEDTKVTGSDQLISLIQSHQVGDIVTFTVIRNNETLNIDVELVESNQAAGAE